MSWWRTSIFSGRYRFASIILVVSMAFFNLGVALFALSLALSHFTSGMMVTYPPKTDVAKQLGCTPLRILCVGDSITQGSLSSSGDGYRGFLQSLLANSTSGASYGADIDFVGTLRKGNMTDNSHQGKSGAYLSDLVPVVQSAVVSRPNVVLIHAGSNDMDKNVHVSTAINRLEAVVRAAHEGAPNATIFLAQLIVSNSVGMQERTDAFNPQISRLVDTLATGPDNFSIVDVNMSRILNQSEIADRKHPDDLGYSIMARAWYDAVTNATEAGMIKPPPAPAVVEPGLGLGLEGELLSPNITCRATTPTPTPTPTPKPAQTTKAAAESNSSVTPSPDPTGADAAATSTSSAASGTALVSSAWLAFVLPFVILAAR